MKKLLKPRADFVRIPIASDICDEKAFALQTSDGESRPINAAPFALIFTVTQKHSQRSVTTLNAARSPSGTITIFTKSTLYFPARYIKSSMDKKFACIGEICC